MFGFVKSLSRKFENLTADVKQLSFLIFLSWLSRNCWSTMILMQSGLKKRKYAFWSIFGPAAAQVSQTWARCLLLAWRTTTGTLWSWYGKLAVSFVDLCILRQTVESLNLLLLISFLYKLKILNRSFYPLWYELERMCMVTRCHDFRLPVWIAVGLQEAIK